MNKKLQNAKNTLNVPWALSGSMAMKMYGNIYGIPTRNPGNVDIVVNRNKLSNAYRTLFYLVPDRSFPPNTTAKKNKNHYNLHPFDLLKANSNLAPKINRYTEIKGMPVVPLEELLKYKLRTKNNFPNNVQKVNANIKKIKELINASKTRTPLKLKRRSNNRPAVTTVKKVHYQNNNFSTPPSSPRKRLF